MMAARISGIAVGCAWAIVGAYAPPIAAQSASHESKRAAEVCLACHTVDRTSGLGPSLMGVVGRSAGAIPEFRYSRAMRNAKIVWDEKTLDAYLADPQKVIPGNVMPFAGIPDRQERAEVIEYLKTLR
jgi:cytochrome c